MTLDLDELERKAKAVLTRNANLPEGEAPYSMGLAAIDVLALIERVRGLEKRDHEWQASTGLMQPETEET